MDALRLPPGDADVTKLSGGERRRVALCRLLLGAPDLLLLDEPTNHLDAESVGWLERHLAEYQGAVVAVTHDRYFLDNVAGWILELDRGRGIPSRATTRAGWSRSRSGSTRRRSRRRPARRRSPRSSSGCARTPRAGARGKARIANYEELLAQEADGHSSTRCRSTSPPGPRLGDVVVEAEDLQKGFGDRLLIEDLSLLAAARRASSA